MKFLPENKKKTLRSIALLIVSVGGIIYLNFFRGRAIVQVPQAVIDQAMQNSQAQRPGGPAGQTPAALPASFRPSSSALLPYGDKIDTSILELDKYAVLKRPPALTVFPDELGKENIFE